MIAAPANEIAIGMKINDFATASPRRSRSASVANASPIDTATAGTTRVHPRVLRIARNAVIDHYRTRKHPLALVDSFELLAMNGFGVGPLDRMLADERSARIRELLDACPDETRTLLAMRYGDGLRHAEIAELLGLGEAVVRKRISRAVRELRSRSRVLEDERDPEVSHAH